MSFQPTSQLVGACRRSGGGGDERRINPVCPMLVKRRELIGNAGRFLTSAFSDFGKACVGYLNRWEACAGAEIATDMMVSDHFLLVQGCAATADLAA